MQKQDIVLVLDNTVFNIAARISSYDLIEQLNLICSQILVPESIFTELVKFDQGETKFKERTQQYITWIEHGKYAMSLCDTRDELIFCQTKMIKDVDTGEADAIAQISKRMEREGKYFVFCTDDQKCIYALKDKYQHIHFVSSLYLIFLLDFQKLLIHDYELVIKEYIQCKPFPKKQGVRIIKEEYLKVLKFYGVTPNKKFLQQKARVLSQIKW
jgi:hypothetical protein